MVNSEELTGATEYLTL